MEFEWDASKEADNLRKHKVSFAEAVESFFDPHGLLLVGASADDALHPPGGKDTDHRLGGMERIQEAVQ